MQIGIPLLRRAAVAVTMAAFLITGTAHAVSVGVDANLN